MVSGAMVYNKLYGLQEQFQGGRCLLCGEIAEPVILAARQLMRVDYKQYKLMKGVHYEKKIVRARIICRLYGYIFEWLWIDVWPKENGGGDSSLHSACGSPTGTSAPGPGTTGTYAQEGPQLNHHLRPASLIDNTRGRATYGCCCTRSMPMWYEQSYDNK